MDQLGPAALGGVVTCLMLWAWALGRWQRGLPSARADAGDDPAPADRGLISEPDVAPVRPCQQVAREERRDVIAAATSLGDIHADVTAYRLAAQVLVKPGPDEGPLAFERPLALQPNGCRYLGVSGRPTCPVGQTSWVPETCESCTIGRPERLRLRDQPSASGLTRV